MVNDTLSSTKRDWIHSTPEVEFARFLYSTSVLDLATRFYFLDHQDPEVTSCHQGLHHKSTLEPELKQVVVKDHGEKTFLDTSKFFS